MAVLSTAHLAKFTATDQTATEIYPELPALTGSLMKGREIFVWLANDQAAAESFFKGSTHPTFS